MEKNKAMRLNPNQSMNRILFWVSKDHTIDQYITN